MRRSAKELGADLGRLKKLLSKKGATIGEIASAGGISERSAHRWLSALEESGERVIREGAGRPVKYRIA